MKRLLPILLFLLAAGLLCWLASFFGTTEDFGRLPAPFDGR